MTYERFMELTDVLDTASSDVLRRKGANYAPDDDRLHNFRAGADILGGTPAQACWGYMTKHLVALRDKVERNDFHDLDALLENCVDLSNYLRCLWNIGNEEHDKYTSGLDVVYCK